MAVCGYVMVKHFVFDTLKRWTLLFFPSRKSFTGVCFEIGRQFTFLENKIQKSLNLQKWGPKSGKFRGIVKWEQKLDG